MTTQPKFSVTNESITIVLDGQPHTVQKGAPQFLALRNAILSEDWDAIPGNLTVAKSVASWAKGEFTYDADGFKYKGVALPQAMNRRAMEMATKNQDPDPIFQFWARLSKNPSYRSVNQLWDFLNHRGIPLTPDGCFLAYKSVQSDYKDSHSRTFDNSPGQVLEMPRNQISDDPDMACHEGFHVGALEYAKTFSGNRIVICKVDPENVVCVPKDSSFQKMRVCKYEVIGNHNGDYMSSTVEEEPKPETVEYDTDEDDELLEVDDGDVLEQSEDDELLEVDDGDVLEQSEEVKLLEPDELLGVGESHSSEPHNVSDPLDELDAAALMDTSLDKLRQYAMKSLKITGASKILGGKTALVKQILKVRDGKVK